MEKKKYSKGGKGTEVGMKWVVLRTMYEDYWWEHVYNKVGVFSWNPQFPAAQSEKPHLSL